MYIYVAVFHRQLYLTGTHYQRRINRGETRVLEVGAVAGGLEAVSLSPADYVWGRREIPQRVACTV